VFVVLAAVSALTAFGAGWLYVLGTRAAAALVPPPEPLSAEAGLP
jgi:hypothetical protein